MPGLAPGIFISAFESASNLKTKLLRQKTGTIPA
jgi:hypothetical protein